MPQLAVETFVSQYFWLVVLLTFFYLQMVTWAIPKIAEIIKTRKEIGDVKIGISGSHSSLKWEGKISHISQGKSDLDSANFDQKVVEWCTHTLKT